MKQTILRISSIFTSIVLVFALLPSGTAHAAASSIYFSPSTGTYTTGTTFSTQVRGTSDPILFQAGSSSGTINFPANRLQVLNISTTGTSYPNIYTTFDNTNGTIYFNGSAYPSPTTITFFTINFRAVSAGSAPVTFSADTTVHYNPGYGITSTNRSNANFTIAAPTCPAGQVGTPPNCSTPPPATCPAGQVGTPPNCSTPPPATCPAGQVGTPPNCSTPAPKPTTPTISDTAVPTPTAQPEAPPVQVDAGDLVIKDVVAKITRKTNSVVWNTSLADAKTEIQLGTSKESLTVKPVVTKEAGGNFVSVMDNLKPGVRYYFTITATAANNPDKKATYSGAFTTRGYPVKIVVTKDGKKIANAAITLEKQSFKTDKNGELSLELTDTNFSARIVLPDKTAKTVNFTVGKKTINSNGSDPETQTFTFDLTTNQAAAANSSTSIWPIVGAVGGAVALTLGGLVFLLYRRRQLNENASQPATIDTYNWEQSAGSGAVATTTPYVSPPVPAEQQLTNLASIEQQYIPETEPQPQEVYEAQSVNSEQPVQEPQQLPTQNEDYTDTQPSEVPETLDYAAQSIEVAPPSPEPLVEQTEIAPEYNNEPTALPIEQELPDASEDTSSEVANSEEAVYHPDTGELDIIHPHAGAHSNTPAIEPESIPTPTVPDAPINNVDETNLPLPPESEPSAPASIQPLPPARPAT